MGVRPKGNNSIGGMNKRVYRHALERKEKKQRERESGCVVSQSSVSPLQD